jgi:hypothetical protein
MANTEETSKTTVRGQVLSSIAQRAPHKALPITQLLLALYQLRPKRAIYGPSWGAKLGKALLDHYGPFELSTERERLNALIAALAKEVSTEP